MGQRTRRSKDLKLKIAIEATQASRQVAEIATEYGVHPHSVRDWKRQLLEQGADVFFGKQDAERKHLPEERVRLYQKVGELQVRTTS